jgi:hypothetical protein
MYLWLRLSAVGEPLSTALTENTGENNESNFTVKLGKGEGRMVG